MIQTRRSFLTSLALSATSLSSGCYLFPKPPKTFCFKGDRYESKEQFLAIDTHGHFFNASDLQVDGFLGLVGSRDGGALGEFTRIFGPYLQKIGWKVAPSAATELAFLENMTSEVCSSKDSAKGLNALRTQQYSDSRRALIALAEKRKSEAKNNLTLAKGASKQKYEIEMAAADQILALPECLEGFSEVACTPSQLDGLKGLETVSVNSLIAFLLEMFQYRSTSVSRFLDLYARNSTIKLDLVCSHLVDFDWWLAKGAATKKSPLSDQIKVQSKISVLTGGKVHAFVPYDPFREAVHLAGKGGDSSFDMVTDAVLNQGAIGVKLYPPMGFAALNNENQNVWKNVSWLPEFAKTPKFGFQLDSAMHKLFEWCQDMQVPIMAHSNKSNCPHKDLEGLIGFEHWKEALDQYEDLRVNFGHFGGAGKGMKRKEQVLGFLDLMNERTYAVADTSYFNTLIETPSENLDKLVCETLRNSPQSTTLVNKVVYGSDWKMLVKEKEAANYSNRFHELMQFLEEEWPGIEKAIYGLNAARYLGLEKGQKTRERLETFYAQNNVDTPLWMEKIDRS